MLHLTRFELEEKLEVIHLFLLFLIRIVSESQCYSPLYIVSGNASKIDNNQIKMKTVFNLIDGSFAWLENGVTIILYRSALRANREKTLTPNERLIIKFSKRQYDVGNG